MPERERWKMYFEALPDPQFAGIPMHHRVKGLLKQMGRYYGLDAIATPPAERQLVEFAELVMHLRVQQLLLLNSPEKRTPQALEQVRALGRQVDEALEVILEREET